jgi:cytochrome P450
LATFEYDPFSAEAMADPHLFYPTLRDRHPVLRLDAYHGWAISRFEDCWQILQDHERFSVVEGPVFVRELLAEPFEPGAIPSAEAHRSFSTWDAPAHTRIRRALIPRFAPRAIASWEAEMRRLARTSLGELMPRQAFDVVGDLAGPYGLANIARVLGLELDDLPALFKQVQRSTARVPGVPGFTESGMAEQASIVERIVAAVARRRAERPAGRDDVLDVLLRFEHDGTPLSDVDVATQLFTLLLGGAETFPKVIAGGLLELARAPEQWQALTRDPSLIPSAFEEMMRHQGVLQHVGRTALEDVEIGGETIRRGDRVFVLLQSANRDEREFREADRFDVRRAPSRSLALGVGRHHCIGSHLARLEGRVLLETFVDMVASYQVVGMDDLRPSPSEFQVGYTRMPIEVIARPSSDSPQSGEKTP